MCDRDLRKCLRRMAAARTRGPLGLFRGSYVGEEKPGVPAPNESCVQTSINIYLFVNGRIVDDWGVEAY